MEGRRENVHVRCLDRDRKGKTAEPRAVSSPPACHLPQELTLMEWST